MQKLKLYKPCLLMVNINNTTLILIGNNKLSRHLTIYLKYRNLSSKDIVTSLYDWDDWDDWGMQNFGVMTCLTKLDLKTHVLQEIDKTIMLVYMAIFGDDSGVKPKISKPYGKAVTWRSECGLFMR